MKKNLYLSIFIVILSAFVIYYFNDITNYIEQIISGTYKAVINKPNEYFKNVNYEFVKEDDDFIPYSYQDLLNIFYSVFDRGYETFTFYCPSEYTDCISDVKKISQDRDLLNNINNFVSPYNSFNDVEVYYYKGGNKEVTIKVNKLYTSEEIKIINNKIDEIISSNITKDMKTEDKILVIHDYIINNTEYDQNKEKGNSTYKSSSAYGALLEKYAVCGGYADAMALFLNRFGVTNYKVSTNTHVWNALKIDNKWLNLDLTWDDPLSEDSNNIRHKFYLIDTNKLESYNITDHEFDKSIYQELA